jgi:voltage-gated sodium channel
MQHIIKKIVDDKKFEYFIRFVIIINTIVLGIGTSDQIIPPFANILEVVNRICIFIYAIEITLEIIAGHLSYFKNGWNVFDFIIVLLSLFLLPVTGIFSSLRFFRLLKVVRSLTALRLLSNFKELRKIIQAIITSLPGIGWTAVLMITLYYIFSIIGIHLFRSNFPELFGSFSVSFVTLFSLTTMEGWQDTVYPIVEFMPMAWIYFIVFFVLASYILLSLIFGIIVDKIQTNEAEANDIKELKNELCKLNNKIDKIIIDNKKRGKKHYAIQTNKNRRRN